MDCIDNAVLTLLLKDFVLSLDIINFPLVAVVLSPKTLDIVCRFIQDQSSRRLGLALCEMCCFDRIAELN